jgi:2-dehydro-3-deoxy-D-arabinonate dehydratase
MGASGVAKPGGAGAAAPAGLRRVRVAGEELLVVAGDGGLRPVGATLAELLGAGLESLSEAVERAQARAPLAESAELLPPVDRQEVWASGVTYERSVKARMEETVVADVYDLVYRAERPELFLKAPAYRVPPPGAPLRIRGDSTWDVPEPELALVLTAAGEIAGYLVADDVSSRSIEGANPLYLPQAKLFDDCVGLSETIVLAGDVDPRAARIALAIRRDGDVIFDGATTTAAIVRSFEELAGYLFRELSHPHGAVLLTGTGLVPPDDLTLEHGDEVEIEIDGVGSLRHAVYRSGA